ncbi:MAG: 4-alpha-glucanotransferase [Ferruginibacter sp.]|nr:4-alpha-glucanotransferase [Cytophagales bacterium]
MKITFQIDYRTQWGQRLYVCGSLPELGNWDPSRALAMNFQPGGGWELALNLPERSASGFQYRYLVRDEGNGSIGWEKDGNRALLFSPALPAEITARDRWRAPGVEEQAWSTAAFTGALMRPWARTSDGNANPAPAINPPTHRFQIRVPLVDAGHHLCLIGSDPALGNWDEQRAVVMDGRHYPLWQADVRLTNPEVVRYKYALYDAQARKITAWENGDDRTFWLNPNPDQPSLHIQTDEQFRFPGNKWKGAGVAIPVFSLRSERGMGVGEFPDLKGLVDWSVRTGLKLIQILPINDTVATHTWQDSYPYAAISVFALHPLYLNLEAMGTLKGQQDGAFYREQRALLNGKDFVDYEAVMKVKWRYFQQLYDQEREALLADPAFGAFLEKNRNWLLPYAVFSYLRDHHGTSEFARWGPYARPTPAQLAAIAAPGTAHYDQVAIHYFIQFHLDRQLGEASQYARQHGVVLKGDIPIGIYRHSVDAWLTPELFHMDRQAGAPPDDFSATGQNWRFPTYNWERMAEDGYAWWQARLRQMAAYFDAYRIDHILGFFRIWEIPYEGVDGLLGHFSPDLPYHRNELAERGIWFDYERFCEPYIRAHLLWDLFGKYRDEVVAAYLTEYQPDQFRLKPSVRTQRQVEELLTTPPDAPPELMTKIQRIRAGLFHLIGEVLFLEADGPSDNGRAAQFFNPRIAFQDTYSYRELDGGVRQKLNDVYVDYFYRRHEQFWREKGLVKLPVIKDATNMLVCGEDLGMVPDVVPGVMQELGLLSLYLQRMPKNPNVEFGHPSDAPYLSVCTTSSHDTSTLRGWWEEDRNQTQRYYQQILGHPGEAPLHCEPGIAREIIAQHLRSPAMWTILPIQDWLATDGTLRRTAIHDERINVPANPQHFWKYRFHLNVEELLQREEFNGSLLELNTQAGRTAG